MMSRGTEHGRVVGRLLAALLPGTLSEQDVFSDIADGKSLVLEGENHGNGHWTWGGHTREDHGLRGLALG